MPRGFAIVIVLGVASHARADKPTIVALAPANDARRAVPIGPAGQVYEPDGNGAWIRRQAGGVAEELVAAARAGGIVIAGARGAPPFKLKGGAWSSIHLELHAKALLGAGPRATAAVGKSVYALDRSPPLKLADAPDIILALAASPTGVVAATSKGLIKLQGSMWKPFKKAPSQVTQLVTDRWALVERGALDLTTMKTMPWPSGARVTDATALGGDTLLAVGVEGTTVELLTIKRGKLERDPIPLGPPTEIVGLAADKAGRVIVASRDGRIAVRDRGTWTITEVKDELPEPKPGPAPATSK